MSKEVKNFKGKIDGISEVKETSKEGLFRFAVKKGEDWYGFSESSKACQAEHKEAQEARDKGHTVEFDYTDDGRWLNITKVKSWNVETKTPAEKPHKVNGESIEETATDPDREKAIAESHMANVELEKKALRERRVVHQTECLEDAEKAWKEWKGVKTLTNSDEEHVRAIANGFMAEDGRKGRC